MMGIYSKIPNGLVALRVKDGKLGELCTAHCSSTHVEDSLQWFLKRDPNNPTFFSFSENAILEYVNRRKIILDHLSDERAETTRRAA